ncbi:UDP-glucuronate decarboxylase 1 [Cricetulus griseus]
MKLLLGIALLAYAASVWGNFVNMRSIQENGELKFESKIEEIVEPLREKIRDLEKSFTQKYPPVKFLSEKDRKRILITGGAGFVGSHLTDKLMMDGHEVTVVDNFFTGRKRNVEHWIGHENFELINHDVVEPLYIEGLAKRVGARLLLASTSEVYGDPEVHPQSEDYWGHVNPIGPRACYDEGKRVAETMCYAYMKQEGVEVRVARIFNTFGPRMHMNDGRVVSNFILQALQGEPLTPIMAHGGLCLVGKLEKEGEVRKRTSFRTIAAEHGHRTSAYIPSAVSFLRSNFSLTEPHFNASETKNQTLGFVSTSSFPFGFLFLSGEVWCVPSAFLRYGEHCLTQHSLFSSDLVNGLVALMNSNVSSPVNLGNPEEHTILEFAQLIKNLVGSGSEIQFLSEAQDDPQKRKPDIKKAKLMLGWEPVVPLEEGLNKAIHYFRKELEYQANNQYIPKPKPARVKKGRTRHN